MKVLKKVISLTMAVIMLVTASPILQAAEFSTSLDRAEIKELMSNLNSSLYETMGKDWEPLYQGIPNVETLKKRYNLAIKNYKENLKEVSNRYDDRETKKYIEYLKQQAEQRVKDDPRYEGFRSDEEKIQAAFYTVLFEELEKGTSIENEYSANLTGSTLLLVGGIMVGVVCLAIGLSVVESSWLFTLGGVGAILGAILLFVERPDYSYFSDINVADKNYRTIVAMQSKFLENPFMALAQFGKGRVDDFVVFYNEYKDCAQVLYDAVDIEYYTSMNQTVENMKARIYTQTVDWRNLTVGEQTTYLHNLAERLRAEAKVN